MQLNFYPWSDWNVYRETIVSAKQATGYPHKVTPKQAEPGDDKVICTEPPPFLCDYALVKSGSVEGFTNALLWYFGLREDNRIVTMDKMLSRIMGAEVKEVADGDSDERYVNPKPETDNQPRPRKTDGDSGSGLW
jgi:hypothetical protein